MLYICIYMYVCVCVVCLQMNQKRYIEVFIYVCICVFGVRVCVVCVRVCDFWFLFTVLWFFFFIYIYIFVMLFCNALSPWHLYLFEPPTTFLDLISFVVYLRDKQPPQHRRPQLLAACAWSTPCWRNSSALLEYFQQSLVGFRLLPFRAAPLLMHRWRRRRVVCKLDLEHLSVRPNGGERNTV